MSTQSFTQRPRGVTILSVLEAVGGALALALGSGVIAVAGRAPQLLGPVQHYAPAIGGAVIALGALALAMSIGLWRGLFAAWVATIAAESLHGFGDLGSLAVHGFSASKLINFAIAAIVVYYLTRPHVRGYFARK